MQAALPKSQTPRWRAAVPAAAELSPIELRSVDPIQEIGWDELVRSHPEYHFFHSVAWAKVLQGTYGFTPEYLMQIRSGSVLGLVPLMEANSWWRGRRGIGLPFTDECPPLLSAEADREAVQKYLLSRAEERHWRFFEIRGGEELFRDQPSTGFLGHRLNLRATEPELLARFSSGVRRNIKKAEKSNLQVEIANTEPALKEFYRLHCLTRQRHGLPPQPYSFFLNIHQHVLAAGLGFVALARMDGAATAGAVYFHFGERAIYKFGASDFRWQELRGNNLVMWKAIQHLAQQGFEHLDFGRTEAVNAGLRSFKEGWGTTEYPISYRRYDGRTHSFLAVDGGAEGWWNHVFRRMPGLVSRWVGRVLYPHWE